MNKLKLLIYIFLVLSLSLASELHASEFFKNWSGDVFLGYNKTSGNTNKGSGSLSTQALKKFDAADFLLKGSIFYSESNKKMDGQKWDGLAKYSFDFGPENRWFNFYQTTIDHDRFADINFRVTPGLGIGYHLFKTDDFTWDIDGGLGYRITRHRIAKSEDDEALTAIAHTFAKRKLFENASISEDLTINPGLKADSGVLLRSETALANRLTENLDLELKYILDFNTEPATNAKKTDSQFIAGIKYKY